jgi:hypothetical protein
VRRALSVTALLLVTATASAGPSEDFESARLYFRQRDCGSATRYLTGILYPDPRIADRDKIYEARAMLGACFADEGSADKAKAEFEKALQLKPKETLDPLFFSDRARRLFDDTKADIENRAKKDEELRKLQQQREELAQRIKNLRLYKVTPYSVNFLPFGLNQRETTGSNLEWALVGGGQVVTLGTSVGIWYYLVNKYGLRSNRVPAGDASSVRRLQGIEIAAGGAFIVLYAYSVWDSIRHYEPQKRISGDQELIEKALGDKPKKTSMRDRLHISPMLTPDSVGVGIGWEN